jgi:hypothetical protein
MGMSKNEMTQAMELVAPRILEEAAFIFSEPLDAAAEPGDDWAPVGVQLRWEGPSNGRMRIWADPALLPVLAANMLGIEEDDPLCMSKGLDAAKETLNMIVGNCLTEAWGPGPVFHLNIPETVSAEQFASDRIDGIWLSAEGRSMLLWCGA